jgi:hypothetical protein
MLGSVVGSLPEGPLVLIGDVHGELEALEALLARPELDPRRSGRLLCFLGDLVDRGPDSPGVVRRVRALVDAGLAVCLLGNHELNLLRHERDPKGDNRWLRGQPRTLPGGELLPERRVTSDAERGELLAMLADLPVALERSDLRLVHACWDAPAIERLRSWPRAELVARHERGLAEAEAELAASGVLDQAAAEERALFHSHPLAGPDPEPPAASALIARREVTIQNAEPVRVLTSGRELPLEPGGPTFAAGGKWRHTRREPWWRSYAEAPAVVVGHYWRGPTRPGEGRKPGHGPPDPFHGEPEHGPLTTAGSGDVHCIDYSVGRRFLDRLAGRPLRGRLAAMLWPEEQLLFDR